MLLAGTAIRLRETRASASFRTCHGGPDKPPSPDQAPKAGPQPGARIQPKNPNQYRGSDQPQGPGCPRAQTNSEARIQCRDPGPPTGPGQAQGPDQGSVPRPDPQCPDQPRDPDPSPKHGPTSNFMTTHCFNWKSQAAQTKDRKYKRHVCTNITMCRKTQYFRSVLVSKRPKPSPNDKYKLYLHIPKTAKHVCII